MSTIDHPSHYAEGREYEPIDVIEDWNLGFSLGNAVKYISRAGRKDPSTKVEDLKKAIWYINREIERTLAYGCAQQNTDYFDRWENPEAEQSNL